MKNTTIADTFKLSFIILETDRDILFILYPNCNGHLRMFSLTVRCWRSRCVKWYFEERNYTNHSCAVFVKPKAQKCGRHTTSRNFLQALLLTNLWLRTKISTLTNQIKKIMTFVCIVVKLTYLSKLTCSGAIRHIRQPKLKSIRSRNYNIMEKQFVSWFYNLFQ